MRIATGLFGATVVAALAVAWVLFLEEPSVDPSLPEVDDEGAPETPSDRGIGSQAVPGPEREAPRSSEQGREDALWSAAAAVDAEEKAAGLVSVLRHTSANASTDALGRAAIQAKSRVIRAEAIFALVRRDMPEADAEILRVFKEAPGEFEKRTVLAGLGAQGNPRHLALLDALRDEAGDGQREDYRRSRSRVLGEGN